MTRFLRNVNDTCWHLAGLLLLLVLYSGAMAQSQDGTVPASPIYEIKGLSQQDLDGNGLPNLTLIEAGFATPSDLIYIYDSAEDMGWGDDWQAVTDFENDTWIFDVGGDGRAQLIMQFAKTDNNVTASIFNDQDGDGQVTYAVDQNRLQIHEAQFPAIVVTAAEPGWYLPDGRINWNVTFNTDGDSLNEMDQFEFSAQFTKTWLSFMQLDGQYDTELQFRDVDWDGIPEYGIWRLLASTPRSWGAVRTWIWSNNGAHQPREHPDFVFWPFLVPAEMMIPDQAFLSGLLSETATLTSERKYFDEPPGIEVNWINARLSPPLFRGYPIEEGFHVNTLTYFDKHVVNYANFEIAQSYYDLANDENGYPELHIRHRYFGANDILGWNLPVPVNEIRWSWSQYPRDTLSWQYKLGLAGRQSITQQTEFPDFSYDAVSYHDLPYWITEQNWDFATFIIVEDQNYVSSEGIYDWGTIEALVQGSPMFKDDPTAISRYLAGQIELDPSDAFVSRNPGTRGEFSAELLTTPTIYFSPVDRSLHLLRSDYCIWNIDGDSDIRCDNLNGDEYLDHWLYIEDDEIIRQLVHTDQYLIYGGDGKVLIKQAEIQPTIFETLPPRNHEEWLELGQLLEQYERDFAPGDFESMIAQFDGPDLRIDGASMRDFRLTESGFRFVLTVNDGGRLTSEIIAEGLGDPLRGEYIIQSVGGNLSAQVLTPPSLTITEHGIKHGNVIYALHPKTITTVITNQGLEDAQDVTVRFYAEGETVRRHLIEETSIDVLGEDEQVVAIRWAPPSPGQWNISVEVNALAVRDRNIGLLRDSVQMDILPNEINTQELLSLDGTQPYAGWPIAFFLGSIAVAAVSIFGLIFRINRYSGK